MRDREQILANLEDTYRRSYERAREAEDDAEMAGLDHRYQRDQLFLEALLDIRELLVSPQEDPGAGEDLRDESLLDKAERLRNITRLR